MLKNVLMKTDRWARRERTRNALDVNLLIARAAAGVPAVWHDSAQSLGEADPRTAANRRVGSVGLYTCSLQFAIIHRVHVLMHASRPGARAALHAGCARMPCIATQLLAWVLRGPVAPIGYAVGSDPTSRNNYASHAGGPAY